MAASRLTRIAVLLGAGGLVIALALITTRALQKDSGPRAVPAITPAAAEPDLPHPFRLVPDRRALQAVADLERLVTGDSVAAAEATFEDDHWRIRSSGREVGVLPEWPDDPDLRGLLVRWASVLGVRDSCAGRPPLADSELAAIDLMLADLRATEALNRADQLWAEGVRDPRLLTLAAHALVLLDLQCADQVGASDRLAARALAVTAAAAAVDSAKTVRDECLLAELLGYGHSACALAAGLPANDPVRMFALHDDAELAALANRTRAREALFLNLVRLARRRDLEGWVSWEDRYFDEQRTMLPVLGTGLTLGRFETQIPAGQTVLAAVVRDLRLLDPHHAANTAPSDEPSLADLLGRFEGLMEHMRSPAGGALIDRDVVRAYYGSAFYSALMSQGDHLRNALSTIEGTQEFADELGTSHPGAAGEFQRWYAHLAAAKSGSRDLAPLKADLGTLAHFGEPLLARTFESIRGLSDYGSLALRSSAKLVARHLDSRPSHRTTVAWLLFHDLLDLGKAEDVFASLDGTVHPTELGVRDWWAAYREDGARLREMASDHRYTTDERRTLLERWLQAIPADSLGIAVASRELLEEHPEAYPAVDIYSRSCEQRKTYATGREALLRWLTRPDRSRGTFDDILARSRLSDLYQAEGRTREAMAALAPAVASQKYSAMSRMVSLLDKLGRADQAESLAVSAWRRYPDSQPAQARTLGLLWRRGKYPLAAQLLAAAPYPMDAETWRFTVAPEFEEGFRGHPTETIQIVESILKLAPAKADQLVYLGIGLAIAGDHALAFEVLSRVPAQGQNQMLYSIRAYDALRKTKDAAQALAWLRTRLGPLDDESRLGLVATIAFNGNHDELLWDLGTPHHRTAETDFFWLLRVASAAKYGLANGTHREECVRYFTGGESTRYRVLGRHLLGLANQADAVAQAIDAHSSCETFYYVGLKCQTDGRLRDAADWYTRCIETNQTHDGEYGWAHSQLFTWMREGMSLDRLAAKERAGRAGTVASLIGAEHSNEGAR